MVIIMSQFMKALTFSYDDGVTTDERLIEIFKRYGMKCTFNLIPAGIPRRANDRAGR